MASLPFSCSRKFLLQTSWKLFSLTHVLQPWAARCTSLSIHPSPFPPPHTSRSRLHLSTRHLSSTPSHLQCSHSTNSTTTSTAHTSGSGSAAHTQSHGVEDRPCPEPQGGERGGGERGGGERGGGEGGDGERGGGEGGVGEGGAGMVPQRVKDMLAGVMSGNKAKLAEAITLVESKHPVKHRQAQWLLTKVLSHRSKQRQLQQLKPSFRVGVSGPPGAGKSTVIETLGQLLTGQGYRVAVLAVDPSSARNGGSILADKTRMSQLSRDPLAYIRPSPSGGSLGGVTRSTHEAICLCEGAGYDVVLVETVGVGQSETAVCDMTDMFLLLLPPAAGDELQGMKRGIVEMADLIVVNKADGDLLPAARRMAADYTSALKLLHSKKKFWRPKVMMVSALKNIGIEAVWETMQEYQTTVESAGELEAVRRAQQRRWLWGHLSWQLMARFQQEPGMAGHVTAMEDRVVAGSMAPGTAADLLLDEFFTLCRARDK